jgi:hypothetical protein
MFRHHTTECWHRQHSCHRLHHGAALQGQHHPSRSPLSPHQPQTRFNGCGNLPSLSGRLPQPLVAVRLGTVRVAGLTSIKRPPSRGMRNSSAAQMPRNPLLSAGGSERDSCRGAGQELRNLLRPANGKLAPGSHPDGHGVRRPTVFAQRCEDGWRQWFASTGIQTYEVVYEDLSRDRLAVANEVLGFARLPQLDADDLPPVRYRRQADSLTERYVELVRSAMHHVSLGQKRFIIRTGRGITGR